MENGTKWPDEVVKKHDEFMTIDISLREHINNFEEVHKAELESIERKREDRNVKLEEFRMLLRDTVQNYDITQGKLFRIGSFQVQRKEKKFFIPEAFIATLNDLGLYDKALSDGAVVEKVEIPYDSALSWIQRNKLDAK